VPLKKDGEKQKVVAYLLMPQFHSPEEEKNRVEGEAFIPKPNDKLKVLMCNSNHHQLLQH
jgi:hypothetical protein